MLKTFFVVWQPIEIQPKCKFQLMTGMNQEGKKGIKWRIQLKQAMISKEFKHLDVTGGLNEFIKKIGDPQGFQKSYN